LNPISSFQPSNSLSENTHLVHPLGPAKYRNLDDEELKCLSGFYQAAYVNDPPNYIQPEIRFFVRLSFGGEIFSSRLCASDKLSFIISIWELGQDKLVAYVCQIEFFFEHTVAKHGRHYFAWVRAFRPISTALASSPRDPHFFSQTWNNTLLYKQSRHSIIPVERINTLFVPLYFGEKFQACPLPRKISCQ